MANRAQVVDLVQPRPLEKQPPLPVHTFQHTATTPGTGNVGKAKPEESLAAKSGVQGCGFDPLRGRLAFSVFHLATMFVVSTFAYSVLVVSDNHCNSGSFT